MFTTKLKVEIILASILMTSTLNAASSRVALFDRSPAGGTSSGGVPAQWVQGCEVGHALTEELLDSNGGSEVCEYQFAQVEIRTLYFAVTNGPRSQLATAAFLTAGTNADYPNADPHDATKYCKSLGGEVKTYVKTFRPDTEISMCVFGDGSQIEAWTLYWGPRWAQDLLKALGVGGRH